MSSNRNSPYFTGVASVLDNLIYQLKVLLSVNPKVPVSTPLSFVEKAKEYWRLGNEGQALTALQSAQDTCNLTYERFNLALYHRLISDATSLMENTEKTDREKNRTAMALWLSTIQLRPFVYYRKQCRLLTSPVVQRALTLFTVAVINVFILFCYGAAIYSLIQLWQISLFSFAILCLITAGCFLFLKAFPNLLFALFIGFVPIIVIFALDVFYGSVDVLPGVIYYLFFMVPLMMLIFCIEVIRGHFQATRYGKLSYIYLRSQEENGKRVWESVIVDTNGNIVRARKSRFRSRVMSPLLNLSATSTTYLTSGQILPLFLFNPSKRMPKTTGFAWWLKSHGFWFLTSAMIFSNPFTWEYSEDTGSFIPLNNLSVPVLWEGGKKAGIEFSDEEIAEFLSRCPSPMQEPPGYEEFVAFQGIEKR